MSVERAIGVSSSAVSLASSHPADGWFDGNRMLDHSAHNTQRDKPETRR
jgi:hypothetical protein